MDHVVGYAVVQDQDCYSYIYKSSYCDRNFHKASRPACLWQLSLFWCDVQRKPSWACSLPLADSICTVILSYQPDTEEQSYHWKLGVNRSIKYKEPLARFLNTYQDFNIFLLFYQLLWYLKPIYIKNFYQNNNQTMIWFQVGKSFIKFCRIFIKFIHKAPQYTDMQLWCAMIEKQIPQF